MIYEQEPEYARNRLVNTIIRLKNGTPIFVTEIQIGEYDVEEFEEDEERNPIPVIDPFPRALLHPHDPRDRLGEVPEPHPVPRVVVGGMFRADRVEIAPKVKEKVDETTVYYFVLNDNLRNIRSCKLSDLDISPVPLGYINMNNDAYFSMRKPIRGYWKQGLGEGNFVTLSVKPLRVIPFVEVYDTIMNNYPKSYDVLDELDKNKRMEKAFHRHWSLSKEDGPIRIMYRGAIVGQYNGNYVLNKGYEYLTEYLGEVRDEERKRFN